MEENVIELNKELKELEKDKVLFEYELRQEQEKMQHFLLGEMGRDIDAVLSGKKTVDISFQERMKYKIKHIFEKIFNIF
jgi:ribosome recycling factor